MNTHFDRLKRGIASLVELLFMAIAAGATVGSFVGGFMLAYRQMGNHVIAWGVLAVVILFALIYGLGLLDQRDELKNQPKKEG